MGEKRSDLNWDVAVQVFKTKPIILSMFLSWNTKIVRSGCDSLGRGEQTLIAAET